MKCDRSPSEEPDPLKITTAGNAGFSDLHSPVLYQVPSVKYRGCSLGQSVSAWGCWIIFVNRKTMRVRSDAKNLRTNGKRRINNKAMTTP